MTLPIDTVRADIEAALRSHRVTILTGSTGSGKSTQIGKILLDMGETAIITQPRRMTTVALAKQVAKEVGCPLGATVGYRVSGDRKDSDETDLLFATEGLALIRELLQQNHHRYLCIDDIHEWGIDAETLLAWMRHSLQKNDDLNLVIMSATLDAESVAAWFEYEVAIVAIPGKPHSINMRQSSLSTAQEAAAFLRRGEDVLVFEPGKKEIEKTCSELAAFCPEAVILPLHAELSNEEQSRCHDTFPQPKCIVATPIAQSGLTFPGIVVVDSGMERQVHVNSSSSQFGIESLVLQPAAQDILWQRAGRSGRTKAGTYVLCSSLPFEDRPEWSMPEIQRSLLEQTALRLKLADVDMEDFNFFHAPSQQSIVQAKRLLKLLGAYNAHDELTATGRRMAFLPTSPRAARMLVEAERLNVAEYMAACVAIIDEGGIANPKSPEWKKISTEEQTSDVFAHLAMWTKARSLGIASLSKQGIRVRSYLASCIQYEQIISALGKKGHRRNPKHEEKQRLVRCLVSGMPDLVFRRVTERRYKQGSTYFGVSYYSIQARPKWIIGLPRDLQSGDSLVPIITLLTEISPELVAEALPHLIEQRSVNPRFRSTVDQIEVTVETWFSGELLFTSRKLDPEHPETQAMRNEYATRQTIQQTWNAWEPPEIELPDFSDPATSIPEIVEASYGTHPATGEALPAYGVVKHMRSSIDPAKVFAIHWLRDQVQAEQVRQTAIQQLERLRSMPPAAYAPPEKKTTNAARMRAMMQRP